MLSLLAFLLAVHAIKPQRVYPYMRYKNTFSRSKKGLALVTYQPVFSQLQVSWFYNWWSSYSDNTTAFKESKLSYVPMISNIWAVPFTSTWRISHPPIGNQVLLGFNEPDLGEQANLSVDQVLQVWPQLIATRRRLGAPAVAYGAEQNSSWFGQFMSRAEMLKFRIDFIPLHFYFDKFGAPGLLHIVDAVYVKYGLPIWITEFAYCSWSPDPATFMNEDEIYNAMAFLIPELKRRKYVERYAWFTYFTEADGTCYKSALVRNGTLTRLGQLYSSF